MKWEFLVILVLLFTGNATLFAQPGGYADWEVKRLEQKLELSGAQVDRVKEIIKINMAELEQLREQNKDDQDAIRIAEKDLEDSMRGQIRTLLTPEQLEIFEQIKESVHLPGPKPDDRLKVLQDRLKLSEEQSKQIEPILLEEQDKLESWKRTHNPGEQRDKMKHMSGGPDFDRPGPPAEIEKIRQETDRKIEALLTPEQLKEYQKIVKERDKERPGPGHGQGMGGPPPEMGNRPQF